MIALMIALGHSRRIGDVLHRSALASTRVDGAYRGEGTRRAIRRNGKVPVERWIVELERWGSSSSRQWTSLGDADEDFFEAYPGG